VHYLCSTFGSAGDVFPVLGLALELRRRGHQITFATNEHFRKLIEIYGLPFEPLGTEADFAACISDPDLWHPKRAFRHVLQSLQPALKRQYEIHAEAVAAGPVIAITNCFGFGALMAQDQLNLPVITLHVQPAVLWSDHVPPTLPGFFGPRWLKSLLYRFAERYVLDPVVCPSLNQWRRELGLPPISHITRWWHSRYAVLCMFPDWYCPPQPDWPPGIMQTDFPLWNHQTADRLAPEVELFLRRDEAPIVFTPGSANQHGQQFFAAAVQACQSLGRRGILLTQFPEHLPKHLPDSIAHFAYIPLDLLLHRAAAFVHHGGIGSTSQAMLAGIPQLLMPLAHDQFDNAARIRRLGIGTSIPSHKFTGPRLTAMLQRLLGSLSVERACRGVAAQMAQRDGISRAADAVEARVARGAASIGG
jgi:rhamnosyltransferase subunit B